MGIVHLHGFGGMIHKNETGRKTYLVGTPGLGKSCGFFLLKYLHDIRVRSLIQLKNSSKDIKEE
jgi:hypothetical protein